MRGSIWVVVAALVACGPNVRDNGDDTGGGDGGTNGDGTSDNCPEEAKLVYVVDGRTNMLSKFNPPSGTFMDLGPLACTSQPLATPFSMGIDRTATAYVLYSSGELFKVDTNSLACAKMPWASANGLTLFGMGFSTEAVNGSSDTLFIAGGAAGPMVPTSALNRLDVATFTPTQVGTVTGWPELSGTGKAELWGFFPDALGARIAKLDKTNGSQLMTYNLPALAGMPLAWAFAAWGGDFYVFLMKGLEPSTTVYRIDGMTGTQKSATPTGTRVIVGAGVSTCAPVIL